MSLVAVLKGILNGVCDEFVDDQSQRNSAIGVEPNSVCAVEMKFAVRAGDHRVCTHCLQIRVKINVLNLRIICQALVCAPNGGDTTGRFGQLRAETLVIGGACLQMEHAGHDLQTVLNSVADFCEQHLMTV